MFFYRPDCVVEHIGTAASPFVNAIVAMVRKSLPRPFERWRQAMKSAAHAIVRDVPFPDATAIEPVFLQRANYKDSYSVVLGAAPQTPVTVFHAVFGHRPWWMRAALVARNRVASAAGLEAPKAADVWHPQRRSTYAIGEQIGSWPIFALSDRELVAGRDNRHLDFRLSLLLEADGDDRRVQVSTVCAVNNRAGERYLAAILPFHKRGLRWLLAQAVRSGRI